MRTLAVVGPHGAGKTSLGSALAACTGWVFHEEIGRRLAESPRMRPDGVGPEAAQARFDEAVFRAERARDVAWPPDRPRIVETWHPGNLAYAAQRSPAVFADWEPHLRAAIDWRSVVVVPVIAPVEVLAARQSEPGDLEFFMRVGEAAVEQALSFGVRIMPAVRTDRRQPERLARQVLAWLASIEGENG